LREQDKGAHHISGGRGNRATAAITLIQGSRENASSRRRGALVIRTDFTQQQAWDYAYIALADAITVEPSERPQDRSLLIVDVGEDEEESAGTFRALASELASIDANLWGANVEFSEYMEEVDEDGVYRGGFGDF
jgi:hypothetical protein